MPRRKWGRGVNFLRVRMWKLTPDPISLLQRRRAPHRLFSSLEFGLEVLIAHVGDVDPRVAHFVHGAVAPPDPLGSNQDCSCCWSCCRTTR